MPTKSSLPTIRDVAERAGVSVATVSRYLNRTAIVSPDVSARLEQVMSELKYTPRAAARNLATHKTNTIGLLLDVIHGDFFAPLLKGVEEAAAEAGYNLLIATAGRLDRRVDFALPLGLHNTDGLLIFTTTLAPPELAHLAASGLPLVLIHQTSPEGLDIPCVTVENKAASENLVDHLIEVHQRRRIVFLRGPDGHEDSYWRERGYREALLAHGLAVEDELFAQGDFDRDIAQASILRLLQQGVPFDAVYAGDDEAAVGVLAALRQAGKRVSEDVAVVGFDDQRLSAFLTPPLTTVRAPTEQVGYTAALRLLELVRQGQTEPLTLLPTEMIVRNSCGCASPTRL